MTNGLHDSVPSVRQEQFQARDARVGHRGLARAVVNSTCSGYGPALALGRVEVATLNHNQNMDRSQFPCSRPASYNILLSPALTPPKYERAVTIGFCELPPAYWQQDNAELMAARVPILVQMDPILQVQGTQHLPPGDRAIMIYGTNSGRPDMISEKIRWKMVI
ncbi:hypothetical protein VTL71DRAFT_14737 [Oculimacula yallundae]|uniref:Uncharacterized protein n=1 Tax=Oculimacula yallundae TaxID=86028 RepID=A0ABR4CJB3_9HELO